MPIKVGAKVPDIALETDSGEKLKLSAFQGKKLVLFFYPGADTPTCTKEACEFRDVTKEFAKKGAVVVGISPDPAKAQSKFKKKFGLPFPLLADVDRKMVDKFGLWVEKSMWGKTFMGVERTTVLIDEKGRIARIWPKVRLKGHVDEVVEALGE